MSFFEVFIANFKGRKLDRAETLLVVVLSAALFFSLVFAFSGGGTTKSTTNPVIVTVGYGDVTSSVTHSGTVVSQGVVYISPRVQERVNAVYVKLGDRVKVGTLLATMDNQNEVAALTQAKVNLNVDITNLRNADANIQALQDSAAQNLLSLQSAVDGALSALTTAKNAVAIKNNNYQNAVDQAQITFNQAQSIYNSYLNFYSSAGVTLEMCQSYNTVNSNCTTLMQDNVAYQNAQISLATAKQNQTLNQQNDSQQIATLSAAYQAALLQKNVGMQKDQQAISAAQRSYATLASQYGVSVLNPKPSDFVLPQIVIANAQLALDATYVRAPSAGEVTTIGAQIGQIAPNGSYNTNGKIDDMFIISAASYQMQSNFNLVDGALIKVGQLATVTFPTLTNPVRSARVVSVLPQPANLNVPPAIQVTFEITSAHNDIYPGLAGSSTVSIRGTRHGLLVPNMAIYKIGNGNYVKKVAGKSGNGRVTSVKVVIGVVGNSTSQIIKGLNAGDRIQLQPVKTNGK